MHDQRTAPPHTADQARPEVVYVLDFGAQYGQLIARRVREAGVYCEILPYDATAEEVLSARPRALILSGGPASVYDEQAPACAEALLRSGIPILGICYGHQLVAHLLGGRVVAGQTKEYGSAELTVRGTGQLFAGIEGDRLACWMSHGDRVIEVPPGFEVLASSDGAPVAAMADDSRRLYGVQFHPEVRHTPFGQALLRNFLLGIAGCTGNWTMSNLAVARVEEVAAQIGDGRAICAVSGGVDSSVAAALVHRAIGERLTCVFVDHGLLRKGEAEQVIKDFREGLGIPLVSVDARDRFLCALEGVADPEAKRRVVGREFVRVFEEEANKLGDVGFLVQGTLYPDVIESGGRLAATIKTHHNVGGLPDRMGLELVEPLRDLFKDEVRQLGCELGVPRETLERHPFPGPGLAVRVIGEVTPQDVEALREADAIAIEEIRRAGWYGLVSQAFVALAPLRSVGVVGDRRTYGKTAILRAVTTDDFMTADWVRLPDELLQAIARRIVNEVGGITRVVYDITQKPPATIEWE